MVAFGRSIWMPTRKKASSEARSRPTCRTKAPLVPFLLDGVAGISALNQADGIHPTAEGQRRIADLLWPRLEPLLRTTSTDD